jgi:hypothetical protein
MPLGWLTKAWTLDIDIEIVEELCNILEYYHDTRSSRNIHPVDSGHKHELGTNKALHHLK